MGFSDRVCVNCQIRHETDKAWLIEPIDDDVEDDIWIPKSQGEVYKRDDGTWDLFAEEWLLKKKGLL